MEGKGCEIQLWTPFKFEAQLRGKKVGYKAGLGGQSLEGGLGLEKHKGKVLTWAESRTGVSSYGNSTGEEVRAGPWPSPHPGNQLRAGWGEAWSEKCQEGGGGW